MTLIRKLASALCLAFSFITLSGNAQTTVDYTTGNLINNNSWSGIGARAPDPYTCCSNPAGSQPLYDTTTGVIKFSYGQATVQQSIAVNQALANAGTGIQVNGYSWGYDIRNMNGHGGQGGVDTLTVNTWLTNSTGQNIANTSNVYNTQFDWTSYSGTRTLPTSVAPSTLGNVGISFSGKDNGFWAGLYGPEVRNVNLRLNYSVDPCATNPAYSPNCAGFNNVVTSSNVFNGNAWGQAMTQAVAINTALQNGGIGAQVHGIKYSFDWAVGDIQCTDSFLFWCTGWANSNINVNVRMTSANGSALLNRNYGYSGYYISGHVEDKYLLPSTMNQTELGNVGMSSSGWGDSYAGNFRTQLIYTPDPCVADPLYSPMCKGYSVAYAKNLILGSTVASASAPVVATAPPATASPAPAEAAPATAQQAPAQQQQPQQGPAPAQDPNQNPSVAQMDPAQPSPTQAGPAPTQPQPAGGPAQTTASNQPAQQQAGPSSGPNAGPSAGPSKLAMSVVKSAQANDKATQQMAVQNAAKTLEGSIQSSQASSNAAISMVQDMSANSAVAAATFASQSTQTSIQTSQQFNQQQTTQNSVQTQQTSRMTQQVQQQQDTQTTQVQSNVMSGQVQQFVYTPPPQQQDTQSTQVAMLKPPTPVSVETSQASSGNGITINRNLFTYNPLSSSSSSSIAMTTPQPSTMYQPKLDNRQTELETPQYQVSSFSGSRAGNPLSELLTQQRFELMQSNITTSMSSVNKNVSPNELAAGVDIASIATVPTGFNAYSFMLKDAAFYEPKEVYKNQRTVDNERVLRGLTRGSDSLHQQMVDSQYKLGE